MLYIKFDTANAAFDDNAEAETARILRNVAARIEAGEASGMHQNCYDLNGNIVGTFKFSTKEEA